MKSTKSAALFNCRRHSHVNNFGQRKICVEFCLLITDLRISSKQASAAAGGGNQAKQPERMCGRQNPFSSVYPPSYPCPLVYHWFGVRISRDGPTHDFNQSIRGEYHSIAD